MARHDRVIRHPGKELSAVSKQLASSGLPRRDKTAPRNDRIRRSGNLADEFEEDERDRGREEERINAIENAAVSGEKGAGIFHVGATLDEGLDEVAELGSDVEEDGGDNDLPAVKQFRYEA